MKKGLHPDARPSFLARGTMLQGRYRIVKRLGSGGMGAVYEAVDRRLIDEVHFYLAPLLCGGPNVIGGLGAAASAESILLKQCRYQRLGDNIHLSAFVSYP